MKLNDLLPSTQTRGSRSERKDRAENSRGSKPVVVGGVPLVSLLPKEMLDASSRRSSRRALLLAVAGVALITGAVIAASTLAATDAHTDLDMRSQQLAGLNAQVAKFRDLQREQQQIALGNAAVKVGGSTTVNWSAQIAAVEGVMPAEFTIASVSATSAEPGKAFDQSTDPLDPPEVATLTVTATSTSISTLPSWLSGLRSMKSYAAANPVVSSGAGDDANGYTVVITIGLDKDAFVPVLKDVKP